MRQISSETILDVEALTHLFSRRQITKESFNPRLLLGLTQTTQTAQTSPQKKIKSLRSLRKSARIYH